MMQQDLNAVTSLPPRKITLSEPSMRDQPYRKIVVSAKVHNGRDFFQAEQYSAKQVFHRNLSIEELNEFIAGEFPARFRQLEAEGGGKQIRLRITSKGKLLRQTKNTARVDAPAAHDRSKQYILAEGTLIPPLIDLGVFTKEGKIVKEHYDKYRQINRFLELIGDVVRDWPRDTPLRIVDFGCGKSYLTFILYYYLTELLHIDAEITGLDLKEEVITHCNEIAMRYGCRKLQFEHGDIRDFDAAGTTDMVITLHACDTATDHALYHAVRRGAKLIFSVPCCQHELHGQISHPDLGLLTDYGIIKERLAALMTDAIRAKLLESVGYRTQVLEFVDLTHTPKNLLLRAVLTSSTEPAKQQAAREQVEKLMREFSLSPTLYDLLLKKS